MKRPFATDGACYKVSDSLDTFVAIIHGFNLELDEKTGANAQLIAAAPDLYSALEECANVLEQVGCDITAKRAFDVLKIARGEQ